MEPQDELNALNTQLSGFLQRKCWIIIQLSYSILLWNFEILLQEVLDKLQLVNNRQQNQNNSTYFSNIKEQINILANLCVTYMAIQGQEADRALLPIKNNEYI